MEFHLMRLFLLIVTTFLFFPSFAFGCTFPPSHMYQSPTETIDEAEWIARVKGISWAKKSVDGSRYTAAKMRVVEYLKGDGPKEILISPVRSNGAHGDGDGKNEGNYAGHNDTQFWLVGGRSSNDPDCTIHASMLVNGAEYLVFGPKDYNYGYEHISGDDDLWLQFVSGYLQNKDTKLPLPDTFQAYIKNAKAVVRFKAKWVGNGAEWSQEILSGENVDYAAMLYASPNAFFSDAINPNCKPNGGSTKNSGEIDMLVVFERIPNEKIRTSQYLECVGINFDGDASISAKGVFSGSGHASFKLNEKRGRFVRSSYWPREGYDFLPREFSLIDVHNALK